MGKEIADGRANTIYMEQERKIINDGNELKSESKNNNKNKRQRLRRSKLECKQSDDQFE